MLFIATGYVKAALFIAKCSHLIIRELMIKLGHILIHSLSKFRELLGVNTSIHAWINEVIGNV